MKIFVLNRYKENPDTEIESELISRGYDLKIYCKGPEPREFENRLEDYGYEVTAYLDWMMKEDLTRFTEKDIVCFSQYNIKDEYRRISTQDTLRVFDWLESEAFKVGCAMPHTWYDPVDSKVPDYISKYKRRHLLCCGSQMYIRGDIIAAVSKESLQDISRWMEESKNTPGDSYGKWKTCEMERRFLSVFGIKRFSAYFTKHSPTDYKAHGEVLLLKNWMIDNDRFVPTAREDFPLLGPSYRVRVV